jgi:uracil-DNA glycosylase family 4
LEAKQLLDEIAAEVRVCENCKLFSSRKLSVPGEGPANAEIMFIGEGPGFYENEQGRPFVGPAGKFLSELLAAIHLKREDVFIANVVKCRPPGNRDPEPDELEACDKYLERQIAAINPHIIVTLGRISMGKFFPDARISSNHGQARWVKDRMVVAMYHPAAALHQPALRPTLENDFKKLPGYVLESKKKHAPAAPSPQEKTNPGDSEPTQLSLF